MTPNEQLEGLRNEIRQTERRLEELRQREFELNASLMEWSVPLNPRAASVHRES